MTDAVTRARELLAAATPGPWVADYSSTNSPWIDAVLGDYVAEDGDRPLIGESMDTADAELIAAAPTLLAELADEVDRASIQMIDRDKLIDLLGNEWGDPVWVADAVLAALPELMGGAE